MCEKSTFEIWKEIDALGLVGSERLKAFEEMTKNEAKSDANEPQEDNSLEAMAKKFDLIASEIKAPVAHQGYEYLRIGILAIVDSEKDVETASEMYAYVAKTCKVEETAVRDEIIKLILVVDEHMTGTPSIVFKENKQAFERYFDGMRSRIIDDTEFVKSIVKAIRKN